jgi:clathrin heavy chain
MFEKSDNIPLIKPFLLNVQTQNKRAVNDAINDLLIEEEDYKTLRDSVENYDNYEAVALAQRLEKHDLVFFRQIAASIYRKNKRWDKSIALSKQDKLYKDAIETSAISGKPEVVEELLNYVSFVESCPQYVRPTDRIYSLSTSAARSASLVCSTHATTSSHFTRSWSSHGVTALPTSPCLL